MERVRWRQMICGGDPSKGATEEEDLKPNSGAFWKISDKIIVRKSYWSSSKCWVVACSNLLTVFFLLICVFAVCFSLCVYLCVSLIHFLPTPPFAPGASAPSPIDHWHPASSAPSPPRFIPLRSSRCKQKS